DQHHDLRYPEANERGKQTDGSGADTARQTLFVLNPQDNCYHADDETQTACEAIDRGENRRLHFVLRRGIVVDGGHKFFCRTFKMSHSARRAELALAAGGALFSFVENTH